MSIIQRRQFLAATAGGLGLSSILQALGPLSAEEVQVDQGIARFTDDIEPLVQLTASGFCMHRSWGFGATSGSTEPRAPGGGG